MLVDEKKIIVRDYSAIYLHSFLYMGGVRRQQYLKLMSVFYIHMSFLLLENKLLCPLPGCIMHHECKLIAVVVIGCRNIYIKYMFYIYI